MVKILHKDKEYTWENIEKIEEKNSHLFGYQKDGTVKILYDEEQNRNRHCSYSEKKTNWKEK